METQYFKLKDSEPAYSIFYAVNENKTVAVCPDPASPIITCYDNNVIEDDDIEDIEECSEFDFAIAYNSAEKNAKNFTTKLCFQMSLLCECDLILKTDKDQYGDDI